MARVIEDVIHCEGGTGRFGDLKMKKLKLRS